MFVSTHLCTQLSLISLDLCFFRMVKMDTRWIKLCLLLIIYAGLADAVILQGTLEPVPVIKNNQLTIKFTFQLQEGEGFEAMTLYSGTATNTENIIGTISVSSGKASWASTNVADAYQQRGYLQGSRDNGFLSLVINSTVCDDKDKDYICEMRIMKSSIISSKTAVINSPSAENFQAVPQAPSEMLVTPSLQNAMEHTNMRFTCSGNVGRPAGSFRWYKYVGSGGGQEMTSQAVQDPETLSGDGCTYTRVSRLTLNLTRTEVDEKLVVRCRVNQTLVDPALTACTDPNTDFCRMSPEINVQYPVQVSAQEQWNAVEGSDLTLVCQAKGNPLANSTYWQKEGDNTTIPGSSLPLSSVSMNDMGTYVCTSFNTIDRVQYNDSVAVNVIIEETTTPPPTTTPVTTTTESTTADGQANKGGSDDSTTVIIVVVVVVVVVIIIVIVAVIIVLRRRKRGKEVEEPPEKPFNNNAGINTVAARPDLVSNSYDNGPPMKNEDGLAYAELQFDNKPRSRRPLAIDDSDYSDVSMPQV